VRVEVDLMKRRCAILTMTHSIAVDFGMVVA
jgi:hypothetical protein